MKLLTYLAISLMLISPVLANAEITPQSFKEKLATLESQTGGRLGVVVINTANNSKLQYRGQERFPTGCTSKVIGVSAILKASIKNADLLNQKITYKPQELMFWSPITEKYVATGMTVAELSAAAISYSDNTAMNLLVKKLGGVERMNAFARSLNDFYFRQDNIWPEEALSGGKNNRKDSSTPNAMAEDLRALTLGKVLAPTQRDLLITWLKANTTGNARIRAGLPKDWIVGDKTGTGSNYGTTNDLAIVWPPHHKPVIIAIYYTHNNKHAVKQDQVVAAAARIVAEQLKIS